MFICFLGLNILTMSTIDILDQHPRLATALHQHSGAALLPTGGGSCTPHAGHCRPQPAQDAVWDTLQDVLSL